VRSDLSGFQVVLQAGGRGERLRNGECLPKPLFPVNGVSMLDRLLVQFLDAGARAFTVITGFGAEQVERAVLAHEFPPGATASFIREITPRGNAGSLALVRREMPCLFCFADLVTDIDFARLGAVHRERQAAVTLASHYESLQVRLGELIHEGDRVLAYREKPQHRVLIASGIAVFDPAVLELVPAGRPAGLSDVVQAAIQQGLRVTHWLHEANWIDVNTREDLDSAARMTANGAQAA
jgi:NDP-sugar pyrophosphorylase family protein